MRRFVIFHEKRHPQELGGDEVARFLSALAVKGRVSASTQNQALAALLFLYSAVLGRPLGPVGGIVHAKRPARLPVVLTRPEVARVLEKLQGTERLMASLLYGSGLRLVDGLRAHLVGVREQHSRDLERGFGFVELPYALASKYPNAAREWPWQWVFPATRTYLHCTALLAPFRNLSPMRFRALTACCERRAPVLSKAHQEGSS